MLKLKIKIYGSDSIKFIQSNGQKYWWQRVLIKFRKTKYKSEKITCDRTYSRKIIDQTS